MEDGAVTPESEGFFYALTMAKKRFTDIEIWDKEWYMELLPKHKCLMKYIFDKCDASGCWKPNWKLASLHINETIDFNDLSYLPIDQYEILESGKIFIPDFVKFQYGKLSKECRPHIPIIATIEKNDLTERLADLIENIGSSVKAVRRRLTENAKKIIFEQDDYQCQYCGDRPGYEKLFVDHIIPVISGGGNIDENLITSCVSCNSKKHDKNVFDFMHKNNITPLINLSKKLDTLFKNTDTLEEEEKDKEKEEEKDNKLKKNENTDFWFMRYYHEDYEFYKAKFNGQSTTEKLFDEWKYFIDFIQKNNFTAIFKCGNFISPHSFAELVVKEGFTRDVWEPPIRRILATGVKPEHDLFFRIPEFIKIVNKSNGTYPKSSSAIKSESTDRFINKGKQVYSELRGK